MQTQIRRFRGLTIATASKPDDVAASDKKPVEDGETDDDSKVVASAKIDVAAGIGDSIKPDTDQKPAAEQKTDTANVAPTNLSAPTITTAQATAIVPAPAQRSARHRMTASKPGRSRCNRSRLLLIPRLK